MPSGIFYCRDPEFLISCTKPFPIPLSALALARQMGGGGHKIRYKTRNKTQDKV